MPAVDQTALTREIHEFTLALARANVPTGIVPLEVFALWTLIAPPKEDESGPYIPRAGGVIKIRPITQSEVRLFETVEEMQAFVENSRSKV